MKKLLLLLQIIPFFTFAQDNRQMGGFGQMIDAKALAGKKFRIEAAVKVQPIDPNAQATLWMRIMRKNKKEEILYSEPNTTSKPNDWAVYSISGKINNDAASIIYGGMFGKSGKFYFDEFHLFVEDQNGQLKEYPVVNGDFEADGLIGWMKVSAGGYSISTTSASFKGNKACEVDASGMKKVNSYGDNDLTGKYAAVNGIKIYYEEYGQGEPLLLLHGNSESINSFRLQIPDFAKQYHVIAVDTRGQGKSSENGKLYTYDLFAEDMIALMDYLKVDKANVVGWSDGGNTGLIMAIKYPTRVKKLVTMGANVFIDQTVVDEWVFKELNKQLGELKSDSAASSRNRERLIHLLLTEPKHSFDELKSISAPVLVVAGEKDVIKEAHTRGIAESIPHSTLVIAKKHTHEYPSEDPAAFNKTVLDFLNQKN